MKRRKWEWDNHGSTGYNLFAKFETTLINFGIATGYTDITDTEKFDLDYTCYQWSDNERENLKYDLRATGTSTEYLKYFKRPDGRDGSGDR